MGGTCIGGEDADADGLMDTNETNPADADSDDDGLSDGDEDANGDGVVDPTETGANYFDTDNDGLSDGLEEGVGTGIPGGTSSGSAIALRVTYTGTAGSFVGDADSGTTTTSAILSDTDTGGTSDGDEDANGNGIVDGDETDPNNSADDVVDSLASSGGGCFIATAAYGSYMEPDVMVLRNFRDRYMLTNVLGRTIVNFYYAASPPVADYIAVRPALRTATRATIAPIVYSIKYPGITLIGIFGVFGFAIVSYRRKLSQES